MILRSKTVRGTWEHVYSQDPALDSDAEGFEELYEKAIETGDMQKLPLRADGQTPTIWRMRHFGVEERTVVKDFIVAGKSYTAGLAAVALLLVGANGLIDDKGEAIEFERARSGRFGNLPAIKPEDLERLGEIDRGHLIEELGAQALLNMNPRNG